jgi:hypothetical protein
MCLSSLGFSSYREYLKSDLWKTIRKRVVRRDGGKCRVCEAKAQCVHHVRYKKSTLIGNGDKWLVSLCHDCHHAVEFDSAGNKIAASSWQIKEKLLIELMVANGKPVSGIKSKPSQKRIPPKLPQPKPVRGTELTAEIAGHRLPEPYVTLVNKASEMAMRITGQTHFTRNTFDSACRMANVPATDYRRARESWRGHGLPKIGWSRKRVSSLEVACRMFASLLSGDPKPATQKASTKNVGKKKKSKKVRKKFGIWVSDKPQVSNKRSTIGVTSSPLLNRVRLRSIVSRNAGGR